MLFEMATGKRPFQGDNALAIISAIIKDPTPSVTSMPEIIPGLGTILERCLAKDAADRYPSAAELHADLETLHAAMTADPAISGATLRPTGPMSVEVDTPRRVPWLVAAVALLAVVAIAGWSFLGSDSTSAPEGVRSGAARTLQPSVAILPLSVAGGRDDDLAFADGIHDDMILQASKIAALKVISRTSVMTFRGSSLDLGQIADQLGVTSIVEASMRRAADRVRVNVKLIDAATEETLWGETFDRELTARNIFDIQSEIVEEIAGALEATLTSGEREALDQRSTDNLEAYEDYILGSSLARASPTGANIRAQIAAFESAVRRDAAMAPAWARLSRAHLQLYHRGNERTAARLAQASDALERAETLEPGSPETALARGYYHYWGLRDHPRALEAFEAAERGLPSDASVIAAKSFVLRRSGAWDASIDALLKAISLDPRNTYLAENLVNSYVFLRRYRDAEQAAATYRALPDSDPHLFSRATMRSVTVGDPFPALAEARQTDDPDVFEISDRIRQAREYDFGLQLLEGHAGSPEGTTQHSWESVDLLRGEWLALSGQPQAAAASLLAARQRLEQLLESRPDDYRLHQALSLALAYLGESAAAQATARYGSELYPYSVDAMSGGYPVLRLAVVQALVGNTDGALASLEEYLERPGYFGASAIAQDPRFDSLRQDSRFRELLLEHGWSGTVHERPADW